MALRNVGELVFGANQLGIVRYPARVGPSQVLADFPKVTAVMAAPMFGATGSRSCGGGVQPCTKQLDLSHDVNVGPARGFADDGLTFSVLAGGVVLPRQGAGYDARANVAIQLYPTLVWAGAPRGPSTGESSVAGLGLLADGRLIYLVASGGSPAALGRLFKQKGATYAGYTDAGSSAALYVRGEGYRGAHARAPKLPAWLVVEGKVGGGGSSLLKGAGVVVGALAVLGLGIWLVD